MKRNPLTAPWLIAPDGFSVVCAVIDGTPEARALLEDLRRERLDAGRSMNGGNAHPLQVVDRVAVVNIAGPLFRHAGLFTDLSDATSDDKIRADVAAARQLFKSGQIDGTVLAIDSSGGEAAGTEQTGADIRALSGEMPVVSWVEDKAQSKALWYATAATRIVAGPQAMLGSMGVRMRVEVPGTGATEGEPQYREITNEQSPGKRSEPLDDSVMARLQTQANDLGQLFIDRVAEYRGVTPEVAARDFGAGDSMIASKAKAAGLIDEIGTMQTALAAVRALKPNKGNRMTTNAAADQPDMALAASQRDALIAAAGGANFDDAIGAIKANAGAAAELATLRAQVEAQAITARSSSFRGSLEAALGASRITLGQLRNDVVPMLDAGNVELADKAIEALGEAEIANPAAVLGAVAAAVSLSEPEARRVAGYLARRPGAALPKPKEEPETKAGDVEVEDESPRAAEIRAAANEARSHYQNPAATAAANK